jgi:DNA repair protein RadC
VRGLRQACELIGVPLLDHLIVTEDAVFSFRESERWGE